VAVIGAAVACVVAPALLSTGSSSSATFHPDGSTFVPNGPVSSFSGAAGRGRSLCAQGLSCYTPQQLQTAYDFPTGWRAPTGAGQTIVVVVAYGNPQLESDLAAFDSLFNIPSTTITYCGTNGVNQDDPDAPSWEVETSADVEYAHAMAPGARIVLAVSPDDDDDTVAGTVATCLPHYPGAIVSQSFGDDEDLIPTSAVNTFHAAYQAAVAAGGTMVAGTGDFGATDGDTYAIASYPASDPLVTAVGGTMGLPYPGGLLRGNNYGAEQVWNEPSFDAGTGGAPSILFGEPSYQRGFNHSSVRTVADVAFNASINGGELVVFDGELGNFGGTSAGPPPWSAIFALADQSRAAAGEGPLGQANPALYNVASNRHEYGDDFNDITVGSNAVDTGPGTDIGFPAGPGYDIPTGLGTPDVSNLIGDLVGQSFQFGNFGPGPNGHGGRNPHHFLTG